VNAWLSGSISIEITLPISPYKNFLNDSNGHGCYIKNCYYFNLWIIHVQSPTNLPKTMWNFVFNVTNVIFFNLKVLKWKLTKSIWIMTHVKLSKNMFLRQRIEKIK